MTPLCGLFTSASLVLNLGCVNKTQVVQTPRRLLLSRLATPRRFAGSRWPIWSGARPHRRKYREFWTRRNNELDQYSVKKWIAGELIALHKRRGDRIHFVTKRIFTGNERLTAIVRETFSLPGLSPVIFTSRQSKAEAFRRIQAVLSYGDSDGDIRETTFAGTRPIRVMRARTSVNAGPVHNGAFGEEVLVNSEF